MSRLAVLLSLLLSTQGPLGLQTLADPGQYLVQSANCDGNPATPLTERTPITCRRIDFGNYQIEDTFAMPNGSYATDWSYPPFGAFVHANGDGGEQYVIKNGVVTITETLDSFSPNIRTFAGPDGWVMFRNDATASPTEFVATLGTAQAYTRYWRQKVTYPNLGTIDTIISEHYNAANPTKAAVMERSFMGLGWGRLVWQAMGMPAPSNFRSPAPIPPSDLATRCPDFGFNVPPYSNWQLNDCRENLTIIPADGQLTPAQLWHP